MKVCPHDISTSSICIASILLSVIHMMKVQAQVWVTEADKSLFLQFVSLQYPYN